MPSDIESQLVEKLKTNKFSIQLDESTVSDNGANLMAYVRFIDDSCKLCEEMLLTKLLETDATGLSIFEATKSRFDENQMPFGNLVSWASDGAPSMLGKQNGFIAHTKKLRPSILAVHCVVHRHHLAAKKMSFDLHESLRVVI